MKIIWYAFHPADYARDTAHLSMIEHGAYRLLLDHYYMTGKPLPASAMHLHRVCRAFASDEQDAVQSVLQQFFTLTDDGWRHERVEAELAKTDDISEKRRRAATLRHKTKSSAVDNHASADANACANGDASADANACASALQMDTQSQSQSHISTTSVVDTYTAPATAQNRKQKLPAEFYPNETGIQKAKQAGISLASELERFRDYHTSKGSTMLDWQAAWRTWVGNAAQFKAARSAPTYQTKTDKRAEMVRELTGESHDESYIIDQQ